MRKSALNDAVPRKVLQRVFPDMREDVRATDADGFLTNCTKDVSSTCMFIWDEMVHRKVAKQPFKIAPIVNNGFKGIYPFVERELALPPITDAYAVRFFNSHGKKSFADVVLTEIYPCDIHISDVEFSDNRKPAKEPCRRYKGLHVFAEFIEGVKEVAKAKGKERVSLLCAFPPLYDVFTRHGFKVSDTAMAKQAFAMARAGFGITLKV